MECRRHVATLWVLCLLGNAFCVPAGERRRRGYAENELDFPKESAVPEGSSDSLSKSPEDVSPPPSTSTLDPFDDDDDDDDAVFSEPMQTSSTGGSNILSLLRLAGALFPSSSGATPFLRNIMREILAYNQGHLILRRSVKDNEIEIDEIKGLKPPPFQRQETEEDSQEDSSDSEDSNDDDDSNGDDDNGDEERNKGEEESLENGDDNSKASDQEPDDDDFSDEPPEGDGQGGGILGLLASLSGDEDGQSDLGSLLATVSGIVVNLSGDGIDINALIASGLGLFVGLLSEGEENPGAVIASYLLTSLDTLTGGGAQNNGAFFGNLVSKLVKGTSAAGDPDASSEEGGGMQMADSAGFFLSLVMSLLGDMSKSSSGGSSHPWRRYLDERNLRFEKNMKR
ncbi:uncharacterized protein LOC135082472 [Ostrinia nubilalis]|uniref:uncharacterized protein LOC135082472 n=1 Tax=Ostrinia nubilalis TaxID=29057 RepID=UPI003082657C